MLITPEEIEVIALSERIGYGRVMEVASEQWQKKAAIQWREGEGLVIGPHVGLTVPCECEPTQDCDWCCGTGWLTKHVKAIKNAV